MSEYIEREAAEKVASKYGCTNGVVIGRHSGLADCIALEIAKLPAADVALVKHGKWITPHWRNSTSCANCSECGFEAQHSDYRGVQEYYKLCPSCGAKMDLEE